jgi:hypothetical protein
VTLGDLLVSTALLGLTVGATVILLEQGHQVWAVGATRVESQQSARAALTWLVAELRATGQGNSGDALPALSIAEPSRLVLHLEPVINAVRSLTFAYFDADGHRTSDPAAVRRVGITLATGADRTRTSATQSLGATLTTDVALRNP